MNGASTAADHLTGYKDPQSDTYIWTHQIKMFSLGHLFVFLALLGASAPLVTGQNPGVVLGITQDGFNDSK